MNRIINKMLLAGDKSMPEKKSSPDLLIMLLLKTKKEFKNLSKKEIQDIFIKLDKACFSMIWFMEIFKIYLEEQFLIKYCVMMHLILLKILDIMDIKEV